MFAAFDSRGRLQVIRASNKDISLRYKLLVYFFSLFQGYSHCVMVSYLLDSMENLSDVSSSLRRVLKCVADLFVLWGIVEDSGSFLEVTNDFLDKKFVSKSDNVMKLVIEMILAQMKRLTTLTFIPSDKQTRTNKRTTKVMMYPALSSVKEKPT